MRKNCVAHFMNTHSHTKFISAFEPPEQEIYKEMKVIKMSIDFHNLMKIHLWE